MIIAGSIACALLGWGDAPPAPDRAARGALPGAAYEVAVVTSGVELIVKMNGGLVPVRLLGIDTPQVGSKAEDAHVCRLSQTKFLRRLVAIGDKVHLATGDDATRDAPVQRSVHVYRAKDGLWINLDMVEQGFATAAPRAKTRALPELQAAEKRAKDARVGMWAPDFLANVEQPVRFERRHRDVTHAPHRPDVFGGGIPAGVAMPLAPASAPTVVVVPSGDPGYTWGYGPPIGGFSPVDLFINEFLTMDSQGNPLSSEERRRRMAEYEAMLKRRDAEVGRLVDGIRGGLSSQTTTGGGSANGSANPPSPSAPTTNSSAPSHPQGGGSTSPGGGTHPGAR
jgi:endonuclease YncB( thermonuclease family)